MRRIIAKGLLAPLPYCGHGRRWPRDRVTEVEVSDEQAQAILADPHLVAIELPTSNVTPNKPEPASIPDVLPQLPKNKTRSREA